MGRRGPQPTPTKLLKLRGSWRGETRDGEPEADAIELSPPEWLSEKSRAHWAEIAKLLAGLQVSTAADRVALAALTDAIADYIDSRADVVKFGTVAYTDKGNAIQHPCVGVMNKAREWMVRLLREFGMTPASRTAVKIIGKQSKAKDGKTRFFKPKLTG